jgi:copper transport protein
VIPRRALLALLVLLGPLVLPAGADAHAYLLRTVPAEGSVVAKAPRNIKLIFDSPITAVANANHVVSSDNASVMSGAAHVAPDHRTLVLPLERNLPDGNYTVRWSIVSDDGHFESGVLAIGVGAGGPPPQAAFASTSTTNIPYLIARWVYFTGLLLLIGGAVYRVAVFLPIARQIPPNPRKLSLLRERHRANALLAISAVLALGGAWVALTLQGAEVAGVSFWQAFNHNGPVASALDATRFGREFGRGVDLTAVFTVLAALAYAVADRSRLLIVLAPLALVTGVWALAVPALSGHATDAGSDWLTVVVDVTHIGAAAVWLGGLAQVLAVTPHATRGLPAPDQSRVRQQLARRFSQIALVSVIVLAVSGVIRALWEVNSVSELWTTGYGRVLIAKTVLFAVLLLIGYRNRAILSDFGTLRRNVGAELAIGLAVIAAVAILTNLAPANAPAQDAAAPAGGVAKVQLSAGELQLWPGLAGRNAVSLKPIGTATSAVLHITTPDRMVTAALRPLGAGTLGGFLPALPAGTLPATLVVDGRRSRTTLSIGAAPAVPGTAPQPLRVGPVAAGEASDLAVIGQRLGQHRLRLTVLSPTGASPRNVLVVAGGQLAEPCRATATVCYIAPAPAAAANIGVRVIRPTRAHPVAAALALPAADAAPARHLVAETAIAFRNLRSLRAENHLASNATTAVDTTYVVQAPDSLFIDVHGGLNSRIIGTDRWDRQPGQARWSHTKTPRQQEPDPYWAAGATAAYVASQTPRTIDVTLAVGEPSGPVVFRITVDRRTLLVTDLHMTTTAHFMVERELQLNRAPPVRPPL